MKVFAFIFSIILVLSLQSYSQTEKLEVDGAVKIGNSSASPDPGTIRWTGSDFEGWTGSEWVSLTKGRNGSIGRIADIEGNEYNTITIGNQEWMTENLRSTVYSDGTPLVDGTGVGDITDDFSTKYVFDFADSGLNSDVYGKLYTWAAALNGATSTAANPSGIQGVCPTGWHIPSDAEWSALILFIDSGATIDPVTTLGSKSTIAGGKMKEKGTTHWAIESAGTTNESGFNALPSGNRSADGTFGLLMATAMWWSTTDYPFGFDEIYGWNMNHTADNIYKGNIKKDRGLAIRCVRD